MIYKLMSVDDLRLLQEKVNCITVKFPKSDKLFIYEGESLYQYGYNKLPLYQKDTGHLVETTVKELLVEMTYQTYQLRQLQNDADYELALAVYEQYFASPLDSEEGRFTYLLSLVIADYEAKHYPIVSISTVDFIDTLLEERQQTWENVRFVLGYGDSINVSYVRKTIEEERLSFDDLRNLSHFFRLPVQAFIVGGYGD